MHHDHLDALESESIFIMREAFAKFDNMAMLWSIGKDSTALLWLARKAFFGHVPFPLVHIDTSYKIPSMIEYRDRLVREWNLQLVVGMNKPVLEAGNTYPNGRATRVECCGMLKKDGLQQVIEHYGYTGIIVGVRRDEDPTRAKERYFSPRNANMEWNASDQPPEFWNQFKTDFAPGTHIRIHPLLHWTELNVWEYIERENIPVIPLYFDDGTGHRYRSLGCAPCTGSIQSTAKTVAEIVERAERDQRARARRPRAGSGERRRVREAQARRLHVMAYARNQLSLVVVGHVDHGKSTLIGRLFYDTGSLPEGKYEQLVAIAQRRGVPFEFANLMDALQAERDQNITIDTSQIWFRTAEARIRHHRRARPQGVRQEHGDRRGARRCRAHHHRRVRRRAGADPAARVSAAAHRRAPGRHRREQDGPRRLLAEGLRQGLERVPRFPGEHRRRGADSSFPSRRGRATTSPRAART